MHLRCEMISVMARSVSWQVKETGGTAFRGEAHLPAPDSYLKTHYILREQSLETEEIILEFHTLEDNSCSSPPASIERHLWTETQNSST